MGRKFAFVGIQLSWNMRPFLGNKGMPFQLFRSETRGNFYGAIFNSAGQLFGITKNDTPINEKSIEPEDSKINGEKEKAVIEGLKEGE